LAVKKSSTVTTDTTPRKRKIEIDDLYRFRLTMDPQVSPDGRTVAYVLTRLRKKKNDYGSNIWLVAARGGSEPRKFTTSDKRDMYPRWSPSGDELAFISTRSGKPQVWVIPTGGGEARQLTRAKRGAGQFCWSPDGRWIVYTTQVDNEQDKRLAAEVKGPSKCNGGPGDSENRMPGEAGSDDMALPVLSPGEWDEDEEDEKVDEDKGDHAYEITRVHIKGEGQGLLLRRSHAFIVPAAGGKERQITEGDWDVVSPRWSPDGNYLALISEQEPDEGLNNISDIFLLPMSADGTPGEMRRVTGHDSVIMSIDWLPNSEGFAVFAHSRVNEGAFGTSAQVWSISLDGAVAKLTAGWDRTAGMLINSDLWSGTGEARIRFSDDGATAYFIGTSEGTAHIFSVPVAGGAVRQVTKGRRSLLNFGVLPDGFVYGATSPDHPVDLYRCDLDGRNEKRLTDVQADALSMLEIAPVRELWIDRPDGERLQGWLMLPPDFDESRKWPLVLQIHGGPHVAYGESFFHEFQVLAARGYIVLYTNPRGGQGYGQEFADAILNDWGGIDYDDLMAFADHAESLPYVDRDRMAVAGGSYGGYMTAWIIGHTNRFKSAVAMRPVTNLYSAWGSGDFTHLLWSWEFEGMPQDRTDRYLERSPVTYAKHVETPLLLTHAEDDYRVDIEQSAEMYIALKILGKTVKMVRFPSGGHDVSRSGKPSLRVERLRHIADWIDLHTKGEAPGN
jgi:dipeptidyl aminopeptidase/acylaminoacyl peptidase